MWVISAKDSSNKFVDQIFQKFLAATAIGRGVAFLEHVSFKFGETGFARFDARANA